MTLPEDPRAGRLALLLRGARTRILAAFVILLVFSTLLLGPRHPRAAARPHERPRRRRAHARRSRSSARSRGGRDPRHRRALPGPTSTAIFDTYFRRNVPGAGETRDRVPRRRALDQTSGRSGGRIADRRARRALGRPARTASAASWRRPSARCATSRCPSARARGGARGLRGRRLARRGARRGRGRRPPGRDRAALGAAHRVARSPGSWRGACSPRCACSPTRPLDRPSDLTRRIPVDRPRRDRRPRRARSTPCSTGWRRRSARSARS